MSQALIQFPPPPTNQTHTPCQENFGRYLHNICDRAFNFYLEPEIIFYLSKQARTRIRTDVPSLHLPLSGFGKILSILSVDCLRYEIVCVVYDTIQDSPNG